MLSWDRMNAMKKQRVLIAGGGIGGLALALTLNQIGVRSVVFESVEELRPLGVGINIQPNAVRELLDLGISIDELDQVGLPALEWALVGLNGNDIYSEPRGLDAGYKWPQYAVHRGKFHMLLYRKLVERAGEDSICLGTRVVGYENGDNGGVTAIIETRNGNKLRETGALLVGADGIHSAIRSHMHPDQPPIHWGGAVMWRGTTRAKPIRTGSSFIGLGTHKQRMVVYPISHPDADGLASINWIAEVTHDDPGSRDSGWFKPVEIDKFIHHFEDWKYDWLDVPALLDGADIAYENPMIDRDPISSWYDGTAALLGDAAHAMYPTGSNGASQAIIDARILGAKLIQHGINPDALVAYDETLRGPVSALILRNRGAGPFGLLNIVDERCGGEFDNIDEVIPPRERAEFMAGYKAAAGFAIDKLNNAPRTIEAGAIVQASSGS